MKGKPYGHKSNSKNDNLSTPYSMTEQLLENEKFDYSKEVVEPAYGKGAIEKILKKYFEEEKVSYNDINLDVGDCGDFLQCRYKTEYIISNPPFSRFNQFVQKAKEVAKIKFAFLGKLDFLSGITRYNENIYRDENYPLTKVYIFTRKPDLREFREDGMYRTGIDAYAWYIWENMKELKEEYINNTFITWDNLKKQIESSYPIIQWINNQKYVLHKRNIK